MKRTIAIAQIVGCVTAVPERKLTNHAWPDAEGAAKITGVEERRQAPPEMTQTGLAMSAARELLTKLDWSTDSLEYLVYVTQTPARAVPSPAFDFHHRMGLPEDCTVLGLNWSCSGYVQGLQLATMLADQCQGRVLLVVGDLTSTILDPADRATSPLFGDAVSATAVEFDRDAYSVFHVGNGWRSADGLCQENDGYLTMNGPEVFQFTLKQVPRLVEAMREEFEDHDFYLFHQANAFILKHLVKRCGLSSIHPLSIPRNLQRFGNCSSASIPLLMCDLVKLEPRRPGRVAMMGFGAGWAWAAASVSLRNCRHLGLIEV